MFKQGTKRQKGRNFRPLRRRLGALSFFFFLTLFMAGVTWVDGWGPVAQGSHRDRVWGDKCRPLIVSSSFFVFFSFFFLIF